jgi:hypothetical protein
MMSLIYIGYKLRGGKGVIRRLAFAPLKEGS